MTARVRVRFDPDLRRSRRAALLRVLAVVPVLLVLLLMTVLATAAFVVAWPTTIVRTEVPQALHRNGCRYLRDTARSIAWLALVADRVRGIGLEAPRLPHERVTVVLRPLLALPSLVLGSVLAVALAWSALASWFVALTRGRTTEGLRELGAFCVRYQAEVLAYFLLLTPTAPKLAPPVTDER